MVEFRACLARLLLLTAILVPASAHAQPASVSIALALTSAAPISGTNLEFTLTANNEGPGSAAATTLTFDVPTNSTFFSLAAPAGWSCVAPGPGGTGTITCSKASFDPGSESFVLTVATVGTSPQGTPVTLTASIASATTDPDLEDNDNTLTVLLVWQANLALTKSGPANAPAGAAIDYTISINNPGPSPAADLVVDDTFAAPLRFVSLTAPGWTCTTPAVGSPGTVNCTNPEIPAGITNLTVRLDTAPSTLPASVTNDVSVGASSDPGGLRLASATTQLTLSADLTIAKSSVPAAPVAGLIFTYTITVDQTGPSDASNVVLTDPLPGAVRFQSITAAGWTCSTPAAGSSGTVSCTRALLPPGSYAITIQGLVPASTPAGAIIGNTASVTSDTPDPTLPNTATASAVLATQADLTIAKSAAPATAVAGQTLITYTITVTQNGPSDAANVVFSDPLPAAVRFQSILAAGWTCSTPALGSSGTISCARAQLAPGGYAITIQVLVSASTLSGAVVGNTASVTSDSPDPTLPNTATASFAVSTQADLSVTITDFPDPAARGASIAYQVVLTNGGPSDAANPSLSVLLDPALGFANATPPAGWTCATPAIGATGTITCTGAAVAAGASASFAIGASVPINLSLGVAGSVVVTTSATVSASTPDPNGANNSATAATVVTDPPAIPTLSHLVLVAMAALLAVLAMLEVKALRSPAGRRRRA